MEIPAVTWLFSFIEAAKAKKRCKIYLGSPSSNLFSAEVTVILEVSLLSIA